MSTAAYMKQWRNKNLEQARRGEAASKKRRYEALRDQIFAAEISPEGREAIVAGVKRRHAGIPKSLEHRAKVAEGMRRYWASLTPERKAEIESQTLRRRWA